jgi:hypothetical protein
VTVANFSPFLNLREPFLTQKSLQEVANRIALMKGNQRSLGESYFGGFFCARNSRSLALGCGPGNMRRARAVAA